MATFTGVNHYWRYEGGALPGVGRYMVNVGGNQNLIVQATDMDVPNKGIDLAFRRTYNSQSEHDYAGTDGSTISNYGDGWTNTFDAHVAYNPGNSYGQGVTVFDIDGARYDYLPTSSTSSSNAYAPPPGMAGSFVQLVSNEFFCWQKRSGTDYCFYRPDIGNVVSGTAGYGGRLETIYGRNTNNYLSFTYSFDASPNTSQNLNQIVVTTEAGQSATLLFTDVTVNGATRRLLTSLERPDGALIIYAYDSDGSVSHVSSPADNTTNANCPAGQTSCLESLYYYGAPHCLEVVYGPRNFLQSDYAYGYTEFGYGSCSAGAITAVVSDGVVNPTIPDGTNASSLQPAPAATGSVAYRRTNYSVSGSAITVSDSDLHQTIYDASAAGNGTIVGVSEYASSSDVLNTTASYSTNLDLTEETDARGNATDYLYDSNGNLVASAEPTVVNWDNSSFRPTSYYSYDGDSDMLAACDPVLVHYTLAADWGATPPSAGDNLCPTSTTGATLMSWNHPTAEPYGELTSITSPLSYKTTIDYATASQGGNTDYGLPTSAEGTSITQDDGSSRKPTRTYTYDQYGNVLCFGNGSGTYAMQYDALNRRTVLADPDDGSVSQCGKPSTSYKTATYTSYYPDGLLEVEDTPAQHASPGTGTTYTYDGDGNKATETLYYTAGTPILKNYWYDGDDRLVEVNNGTAGNQNVGGWLTDYWYDLSIGGTVSLSGTGNFSAYGNMFATVKLGVATKGVSYDGLDREVASFRWPMSNCASSCNVASRANTYDSTSGSTGTLGLLSSTKDELGNTKTFSYDQDARVYKIDYSDGITPNESMTYDADKRVIGTTSSVFGTMTDTYDAAGHLIQRNEPLGGGVTSPVTISYDYYADGLRKDLGVTKEAGASSNALSQSPLFEYSYRSDGMRKTLEELASSGNTTVTWTQSAAGRYTAQTMTTPAPSSGSTSATAAQSLDGAAAMAQSLDAASMAQALGAALPAGLANLSTTASNASTSSSSSTVTTVQTYDTFGRAVAKSVSNGSLYSASNAAYDLQDELTAVTVNNGSQSYTRELSYDGIGEVVSDKPSPGPTASDCPSTDATVCGYASEGYSTGILTATESQTGSGKSTALQSPDPRYGAILSSSSASSATPPPACGGVEPGSARHFTFDAAGRETSGQFSWTQNVVKPSNDGGKATVCNPISGSGSMAQTFDSENRVVSNQETNYGVPNTYSSAANPISWAFKYGPDGHVKLATTVNSQAGQTDTAELHWDGDSLLFETDQLGTTVFLDGAFSNQFDFDFAGYTKSAEGYQLSRYQFQQVGNQASGAMSISTPYYEAFMYTAPGMITDGVNTFQGVRQVDNNTNTWTTPDAYAGEIEDPMSQQPYVWDGNNPVRYSDPSGYCPVCAVVLVPVVEITVGDVLVSIGAGAVGSAILQNGKDLLHDVGLMAKTGTTQRMPQATYSAEHTKKSRPSTEGKHEEGKARKRQDAGGEKGDANRRFPRKPQHDHEGPYPPDADNLPKCCKRDPSMIRN